MNEWISILKPSINISNSHKLLVKAHMSQAHHLCLIDLTRLEFISMNVCCNISFSLKSLSSHLGSNSMKNLEGFGRVRNILMLHNKNAHTSNFKGTSPFHAFVFITWLKANIITTSFIIMARWKRRKSHFAVLRSLISVEISGNNWNWDDFNEKRNDHHNIFTEELFCD